MQGGKGKKLNLEVNMDIELNNMFQTQKVSKQEGLRLNSKCSINFRHNDLCAKYIVS